MSRACPIVTYTLPYPPSPGSAPPSISSCQCRRLPDELSERAFVARPSPFPPPSLTPAPLPSGEGRLEIPFPSAGEGHGMGAGRGEMYSAELAYRPIPRELDGSGAGVLKWPVFLIWRLSQPKADIWVTPKNKPRLSGACGNADTCCAAFWCA